MMISILIFTLLFSAGCLCANFLSRKAQQAGYINDMLRMEEPLQGLLFGARLIIKT